MGLTTAATPIPILLLTGYLGAGKTTLLNRLLAMPWVREARPALVINEFGALGVDGALVSGGPWARYELNKGSLFCVCVKTDFIATLRAIAESDPRPGLVVIEATGVAEPRDLEAFVDAPGIAEAFRIRANLCVVDAAHFVEVAPMLRAARAQVERADGLLVTKTDLTGAAALDELERVLRSMNPSAPIVHAPFGAADEAWVHALEHRARPGDLLQAPPDPLFSASFETAAPVDRARFYAALGELGDRVLRLKGRVDFGQGPVFVEKAGGALVEKPNPEPSRTGTRFVVIAWRVRETELRERVRYSWE